MRRRPPRSGRRVAVSAGLALLVVLVGVGAFLAYENTLPTTVSTNFKNGQKDVPTDARFLISFSRSVAIAEVEKAFSITPATDGVFTSVYGQTQYAWTSTKPLAELTTYTVTMKPIVDLGHHRIPGAHWSFTTIIVPRVVSVTTSSGTALKDGSEIDPGDTLQLTFNDAMEPVTVKVMAGTQVVNLKWASDNKSASFSTAGIPSGPLTV